MNNNNKNNQLNKALKETLNIEDNNITITDLKTERIKGINCKVYQGILTLGKEYCPKCGTYHNRFYIHNYKYSLIKIPNVSEFTTYLRLKKTRYKCLECGKTFVPETKLVNKGCFISNYTKNAITYKLCDTVTMKYIARQLNVSSHSVMRILDAIENAHRKSTYKSYLPEVLHFDEFKATKDAKGNMAFIMMDGIKKEIIDVVENRQTYHLENYFSYYTKEAKDNVKYIVIDMYTPYIELIKKTFSNATIVFDRFHIVQNLTRAFNKVRIQVMKNDPKNYKKFKNHWKLFLKLLNDVSMKKRKNRHFKNQWISNKEIIEYLCENNSEFKINYEYYQDILFALKYKNKEKLAELIHNIDHQVSPYLQTCISTYIKHQEYVENGLEHSYNNGIIEGTISKIKKLKTIACGYRKFERFKARIFITENLIKA